MTSALPPEAAYLLEPPDRLGTPPVVTRPQRLAIDSFSPMDFERLCYRLASIDGEVEHCQIYGIPGQAQDGVDVIVRRDGGLRVIQCKRRSESLRVSDLVSAVDMFIAGKWRSRADELVVAVSSSVEPTQLADQIEIEREKLARLNIRLTIWDEATLSTKLKGQPEIVADFFGHSIATDFLGTPTPGPGGMPAPIISCPYILNPDGHLFGRDATLGRIRAQLNAGGSRVVAIVGVAGAGKSALAWRLFQGLLGERPARRLVWHSFYDPEGDLDRFLLRLADAFGVDVDAPDLVDIILSDLALTGAVVMLDGFERLLEYSQRALDVGSLGVSGAADRLFGPQLGLGIASFRARKLVLGLVALPNVHVVLTSRAIPTDLTDHTSHPLPSVQVHYLEGLGVDATIELWKSRGVKTDVPAATLAVESLAGHALSLIVLGLAARGRDATGVLTAKYVYDVRSRGSSDGSFRDAVLASALERHDRDTRILLALIGAMGGSPRLDALKAQDVIADVGRRLEDLAAGGLVTIDHVRGMVGAHPLSCEAAAADLTQPDIEHLSETARAIADSSYQALDWELEGENYIEWINSGDYSDRNEVAALCRGLVAMGKLDEAEDLYRSQLSIVFMLSIGANVDAIGLLWPLHAAARASDRVQPWTGTMLVHHLAALGWDEQAWSVAADLPEPERSVRLQLALAIVDGRAKRPDDAARRVAHALREARLDFAFASGYSYGGLQFLGEKWLHDMNGPVTDLVEAQCAAARLLINAGQHARAALLLLDALENASTHHPCGGCQARVAVEVARLLLSSGDARRAARMAERAVALAAEWAVPVRSVEAEAIQIGANLEAGDSLAAHSRALVDYQARMATQGFEFCSRAATAMLEGQPLKAIPDGPLAGSPLEHANVEQLSNWLLDEVIRRGTLPTPSKRARDHVKEVAQTLEEILEPIARSLLPETRWNELFELPRHVSEAEAERLGEGLGTLPALLAASGGELVTQERCDRALGVDPGCVWAHEANARLAQTRDEADEAFEHALERFRWRGGTGGACRLVQDLAVTDAQQDQAIELLVRYARADHEPHFAMLAAAGLLCRRQDWAGAYRLHAEVLDVGWRLVGSPDMTYAHRAGAVITAVLSGEDDSVAVQAVALRELQEGGDNAASPERAWLRFLEDFARGGGAEPTTSLVPAPLSSEAREELRDLVYRAAAGLAHSANVGEIAQAAADRYVGPRDDPASQ
jgi:hypothetical protein